MRRILAGVVSFVVGLAVFIVAGPFISARWGAWAGFSIAVSTYALIDRLGILPPPLEHTASELMLEDQSESSDNGKRN